MLIKYQSKNNLLTKVNDQIINSCVVFIIVAIPCLMLMFYPIEQVLLLTFLVKTGLLTFQLWIFISRNDENIANIFVFIFFYLFFLIAPIIQLGAEPILLVNTLPYEAELAFFANLLTILFLSVYIFTYTFISTQKFQLKIRKRNSKANSNEDYKYFVLIILILISCFVALIAIQEMMNKTSVIFLLEARGINEDISDSLIRKKVIYNLPLATFIYLISLKNIRYKYIFLIVILLLIVITKNPLLEKRNGLGATYLLVLYYFLEPYFKNSRTYFLFYFLIFIIFFPLSSILTHSSVFVWMSGLGDLSLTGIIFEHFEKLHYDAWANFMATIDYVQAKGPTYGYQLLGTILFFFPRSLWRDKPQATGTEVANYLIDKYNMWFNNLSNPLQAEGYIDFGIIGVIIYAVILASISAFLGNLIKQNGSINRYAAVYVASSYIFILRGSLMSGVAYTLGALIAILIIPKLIEIPFRFIRFKF